MIGETIGNFRIVSLLGKGGMGEVWLAENTNTAARVAIKVLRTTISEDTHNVQRLFNEAIAVSRIPHAGIVRISDSGFHLGQAYLVMELLEGETLHDRVSRLGRLPVAAVCEIGIQIASVLEATHAAGVTHRDLKPDNVFLILDAGTVSGERVKVLDFGLAKLQGNPAMTTSTITGMGTPLYMSPEQWRSSANVDSRADLYSLGCVMFEMTCGRPPFEAATFAEACAKHLAEVPPLASDFVALVPESLDRLLARLLAKDPAARPTLIQVREALEAISHGRAIAIPRALRISDHGLSSSALIPAGRRSSGAVAFAFVLGAVAFVGLLVALARSSIPVGPMLAQGSPDAGADGVIRNPTDPVFVSPSAVRRIGGDLPILANSVTLQVCIDPVGHVTTVETPVDIAPAVAREVNAAVLAWSYKPYTRAGQPIAACFLPTIAPAKLASASAKSASAKPATRTNPKHTAKRPKPRTVVSAPPAPIIAPVVVPPPPVTEPLPDRLDQRVIMASLGQVYERANACATAPGELRVTIAISPDGRVSNVVITPTTDDRLVACVTAVYAQLTFARSSLGGAFNFALAIGEVPVPVEPGSDGPNIESTGKMVHSDRRAAASRALEPL